MTSLHQYGHVVAMEGDGINNSEALAKADVGIAMDVARLTLISSDLNTIPKAITLSRRTVSHIRNTLFWAFICNVLGIPFAAAALYPLHGFLLDPIIALAGMALSSASVVSNSLRLKHTRL